MHTKPFNTRAARRARQEWHTLLVEMMDLGSRMQRTYGRLRSAHGEGYIEAAIDCVEIKQMIEKFHIIEEYSASFFAEASPRVAHAMREAIASAVNEDAEKAKPAAAS